MGNNAFMSATQSQPSAPFNTEFKLGKICIDPIKRTLSRDGLSPNCEPKVFDLLVYFCQKSDQIITREMLLQDIWLGRTVSDNAINRKIYQLRKLLADLDDSSEYIETIPKFGYRLMVPITELTATNPPNPIETSDTNRRPVLFVAMAALLLIAIMMAILQLSSDVLDNTPRLKQLTALPGVEHFASISPDGKQLLFSFSETRNTSRLMLKDLTTGKQIALTEPQGHDVSATWHPNGQQIAFVRRSVDGEKCGIYLIELNKSDITPQKLIACSQFGRVMLSWSVKSDRLFFADRAAKNRPYIIYQLDIANRVKKQLTQPPLNNNLSGDYFITRNTDGNRQIVLRYLGSNKVEVSHYQSHPFEKISSFTLAAHIDEVALSADEKWLYYRAGQNLKRVHTSGKPQQQVFHLGRDFQGLQFSHDGTKLLLNTFEADTDIWQFDAGQATSFIGSTRKEMRPRFANQSSQVAFLSNRSGSTQFWLKTHKGELQQLSDFDFELNYTWFNWSPDDSQLLFEHQDAIYSFTLKNRQLKQLIAPEFKPYFASWAIDGKSLYVGSVKSGDWQIWQYNLLDNSAKQLTVGGGYSAFENPVDGSLYITKYHQDGLWRLNSDGSESLVLEDFSLLNWLNWSIKDNQIIYADPYKSIYRYDLSSNSQTKLMDLDNGAIHDHSVSRQTGQVLFTKHMSQSGDILMLQFSD